MTHPYVTWLVDIWHDSSIAWHESFICDMTHPNVTWLVHMWHDAFTCDTHSHLTWLIHMWHDSFIRGMTHLYVTWLIYRWHYAFICDRTHSYVTWLTHIWHDSFTCDMTGSYVTWLIYTWHDSFICDTLNSQPQAHALSVALVIKHIQTHTHALAHELNARTQLRLTMRSRYMITCDVTHSYRTRSFLGRVFDPCTHPFFDLYR